MEWIAQYGALTVNLVVIIAYLSQALGVINSIISLAGTMRDLALKFVTHKIVIETSDYRYDYLRQILPKHIEFSTITRREFEGGHIVMPYEAKFVKLQEKWMHFNHFYNETDGVIRRQLVLHVFGKKKNAEEINEFLTEIVRREENKAKVVKTGIWHLRGSQWSWYDSRTLRPDHTLFYDNDLQYKLLEDMEAFLKSEDEHLNRGKFWKRNFILYGDPGNGKSSLILWLAGKLKRNLNIINTSDTKDEEFVCAISDVRSAKTILVLEDIDVLIRSSRTRDDKESHKDGLSLATLLSVLDGPFSKRGLIICMTTNKFKELDKALTRRGRSDVIEDISNPNHETVKKFFQFRYPKGNSQAFIDALGDCQPSMAELEYHFDTYTEEQDAIRFANTCRQNSTLQTK